MFTEWLRKVFAGLMESIARFLGRLGIGANAITIIGCMLTTGVSVLIAMGRFRLGGILLIATSLLDNVDGTLARLNGKPTKFGAFLDSVLDRVSESVILLAIAWWYMGQAGLVEEILAYVSIVGSFLVSYARGRAETLGIECKVGLFTRVERCIVVIAALILGLTSQALWLLAIGTVLTALHRVIHVYKAAKDEPLSA